LHQYSLIFIFLTQKVIVYTIAALTFERYYCVREKTVNKKVSRRYILIYIIILWSLALLYALPGTMSVVLRNHEESHYCDSLLSDSFLKIYISSKFIVCFAFPYTVLIIFSILLLVFLKKWSNNAKKLKKRTNSEAITEHVVDNEQIETALQNLFDKEASPMDLIRSSVRFNRKSEDCQKKSFQQITTKLGKETKKGKKEDKRMMIKRRSTRFVLAVVSSFLCCWSPLWLFQLINLILQNTYEPEWLKLMNNFNIILVYGGGAINPLLFMLLTENFREKVFKKIIDKFKN
jgi:competence protein ComGC